MSPALLQTDLPFPVRRGKVRDVYDLSTCGRQELLIIATDRISAFDCIMPNGIPDKGRILTALSLFWFRHLKDFENHLLASEVADFPRELHKFRDQLAGRSMLVRKAQVVPIECVARGYLAGSGWKEYQKSQTVCGIKLPPGLKQCDKLPNPIFTPATKEESGHDINVSFDGAVDAIIAAMMQGVPTRLREPANDAYAATFAKSAAEELRDRTLAIYKTAADYAAKKGILIADTKFEFGQLPDGNLILVDEVLTPDSSRFWPANDYEPGHDQPSFDKQFVRNWLEAQPWNKQPPAPALPTEVVLGTRKRYLEAYERLTGRRFE